jgi:hypothetical protein
MARSLSLLLALALSLGWAQVGEGGEPLQVRAEVAPGPYFVGQGFVVRVDVAAGGKRPKIDAPRMPDALAWPIDKALRPISSARIGSVFVAENLFEVQFRVVPKRAGPLEIPAIQAQVQGRSGRSQPKRVLIKSVPLQGRPAEFLGGVGRFDVQAEASPKVLRVGQELEYRIKITGPAAWGTNGRPDLERFGKLGLALRVEPMPDAMTQEPPGRTFAYRLRPMRAGEAVLPPVAIAAFDPGLASYVTHVTVGVPIRVVAVPPFDPTTIHYDPPSPALTQRTLIAVASASAAILLLWAFILLRQVQRRLARSHRFGPAPARRFARRTARYLGSVLVATEAPRIETVSIHDQARPLDSADSESPVELFEPSKLNRPWRLTVLKIASPSIVRGVARRVAQRLAHYLELATGHSPIALTPDEARQRVAWVTHSDELAAWAAELTEACDSILYGDSPREPDQCARQVIGDARRLFQGLGRAKFSKQHGG